MLLEAARVSRLPIMIYTDDALVLDAVLLRFPGRLLVDSLVRNRTGSAGGHCAALRCDFVLKRAQPHASSVRLFSQNSCKVRKMRAFFGRQRGASRRLAPLCVVSGGRKRAGKRPATAANLYGAFPEIHRRPNTEGNGHIQPHRPVPLHPAHAQLAAHRVQHGTRGLQRFREKRPDVRLGKAGSGRLTPAI